MAKTRSHIQPRRETLSSKASARHQESCPLCRILSNESVEQTFTVSSNRPKKSERIFFIVATKNKKGHDHRYMVVVQEHARTIDSESENQAISRFFGFMKQFNVDFAIMESTHATIANHWHIVGTDLNPKADDAKQIIDTDRVEVRRMNRAI